MPTAQPHAHPLRGVRLWPIAALALGVAVSGLSWHWGEVPGLQYLAVYLLSLIPGLPLGFAVFGSRHAVGWVAGALLGYGLTAGAI